MSWARPRPCRRWARKSSETPRAAATARSGGSGAAAWAGLVEPENVINLGNSGTGARLIMGVIAGHDIAAVLTGDASLRGRPMGRVAAPLRQMGARIEGRAGDRLPARVAGATEPLPIRYPLPVPSAQVKSAVLLAGLTGPGRTTVVERARTRDHSENMLRHFGADIAVGPDEEVPDAEAVSIAGQAELVGTEVAVPADPSSAAFPLLASALLPGSSVTVPGVCLNPRRSGVFTCLKEMGANLRISDQSDWAGEPVGTVTVRGGLLQGIDVPAERAPSMIDEYPILAVAAACAEGRTLMRGLGELRVKGKRSPGNDRPGTARLRRHGRGRRGQPGRRRLRRPTAGWQYRPTRNPSRPSHGHVVPGPRSGRREPGQHRRCLAGCDQLPGLRGADDGSRSRFRASSVTAKR